MSHLPYPPVPLTIKEKTMNEQEQALKEQIMFHTISITEIYTKNMPTGIASNATPAAKSVAMFMEVVYEKVSELYQKKL